MREKKYIKAKKWKTDGKKLGIEKIWNRSASRWCYSSHLRKIISPFSVHPGSPSALALSPTDCGSPWVSSGMVMSGVAMPPAATLPLQVWDPVSCPALHMPGVMPAGLWAPRSSVQGRRALRDVISGHGGDGLTVGFNDLQGLFQPLMTLWFFQSRATKQIKM